MAYACLSYLIFCQSLPFHYILGFMKLVIPFSSWFLWYVKLLTLGPLYLLFFLPRSLFPQLFSCLFLLILQVSIQVSHAFEVLFLSLFLLPLLHIKCQWNSLFISFIAFITIWSYFICLLIYCLPPSSRIYAPWEHRSACLVYCCLHSTRNSLGM